ncbi:MAG: type III-B CRISPR module RAMP protein Cmr6 [Limnochordia bacterium]|jgi:CRISPR-associated protein Cmr6|nr:type III-B CRISPR module RAMP protein Cmr6 [Limnochordia bacterium]
MLIPLYQDERHRRLDRLPNSAHCGLWYDKFCNQWRREGRFWGLAEDGKETWITTFAEQVELRNEEQSDNITGQLEEMTMRVERLVVALNGQLHLYKTTERFVTGMGRNHPMENGFLWHWTLGSPYLPGSSIKGLVKAWATGMWEPDDGMNKSSTLIQVFGTDKDSSDGPNEPRQIGDIIFFDALPTKPVNLTLDIITPHYGPYYQESKGKQPPADWYDPVPIPFLVAESGAEFAFPLASRSQDTRNLNLVSKWLEEALSWMGAGAKVSSGYGRFERNKRAESKRQAELEEAQAAEIERKRLESMPPLQREMEQDDYSSSKFIQENISLWLERMEDPNIALAERKQIAQLLLEWYHSYRPRELVKPNRKNRVKLERIQKVLSAH